MLTPFGSPIPGELLSDIKSTVSCVKPVRQSALFNCLVRVTSGDHGDSGQIAGPLTEVSNALRSERILVAEDNEVNREVALGNLRKLGCTNPGVAANGLEVLAALRIKPYDIILMDCRMPELDGYEASKHIRRMELQEDGHRTWIVAVTANAMASDRQKCPDAGMDDYVSKPLGLAQLRAALERAALRRITPLDGAAMRKSMEGWSDDEFGSLVALMVKLGPSKLAEIIGQWKHRTPQTWARRRIHSKAAAAISANLRWLNSAADLKRRKRAAT